MVMGFLGKKGAFVKGKKGMGLTLPLPSGSSLLQSEFYVRFCGAAQRPHGLAAGRGRSKVLL